MSGFSSPVYNNPLNYAARAVNPIYNPAPVAPQSWLQPTGAEPGTHYVDYRTLQFGKGPEIKIPPAFNPNNAQPVWQPWGMQGYVPPKIDPLVQARQILTQLAPKAVAPKAVAPKAVAPIKK